MTPDPESGGGRGKVWLVGAGPGDPGLITVAALERLREADVIVYDRLVSPRLLEHTRHGAELIFVGKTPHAVILSPSLGHSERSEESGAPLSMNSAKNLDESNAERDHEILRRSGPLSMASAPQNDISSHDQDAINRLLVEKGLEGKRVVRLKGGDPFVFGRGGEEAEALRAAAVPFEVVPGVTSAVAVPAYAGIPVTHRGVAATFAVVTGHEDPDKEESAIDWGHLATAVDTLVLLMGVKTLPDTIEKLVAGGRPPDTPVAVIRWGTTPDQRTVTGTLADIVRRVREAKLQPPAITVVGEVVRLRETLAWFEDRPLFGKRVLITRTRRQASVLARLLAEEGAVPIELPTIEIQPLPDAAARLRRALDGLRAGDYRWVVFTSANAVEPFFDLMRERGLDARAFAGAKVAAIGPATADALAERGIVADVVPGEYVAEGLVAALTGTPSVIPSGESGLVTHDEASRGNLGRGGRRSRNRAEAAREPPLRPGDRVLVPRAEGARPELIEGLSGLGAKVDEVTLYRAVVPKDVPAEALSLLRDGGIDIVTFTSSSTVRNLASLLGDDFHVILSGRDDGKGEVVSSRRNLGSGEEDDATAERGSASHHRPLVACIGPITAQTARELGLRVDVEASEHTIPGLVAAIRERVSKETGHAIV